MAVREDSTIRGSAFYVVALVAGGLPVLRFGFMVILGKYTYFPGTGNGVKVFYCVESGVESSADSFQST